MSRLVVKEEVLTRVLSVDDLCEKIVEMAQSEFPIAQILAEPRLLKVSYRIPEELEGPPPPLTARDTIEGVLSEVQMREVLPEKIRRLSMRGLRLVDTMLQELAHRQLHGVGWVIGDREKFCDFFGLFSFPDSFFDMSLHVVQTVNEDKIILLGASSRLYRPRQVELAICSTMVEQQED